MLDQIRAHCSMDAINHPTEFPFPDVPFDTIHEEQHLTDGYSVEPSVLRFLTGRDNHGIGGTPVFAYKFLSRAMVEDEADFWEFITNTLDKDVDTRVKDMILLLGHQFMGRYATLFAKLFSVKEYAIGYKKAQQAGLSLDSFDFKAFKKNVVRNVPNMNKIIVDLVQTFVDDLAKKTGQYTADTKAMIYARGPKVFIENWDRRQDLPSTPGTAALQSFAQRVQAGTAVNPGTPSLLRSSSGTVSGTAGTTQRQTATNNTSQPGGSKIPTVTFDSPGGKGTPRRTAYDPQYRDERIRRNRMSANAQATAAANAFTNSGTVADPPSHPRLITYTAPSSSMNIKWDGKNHTLYTFIQRVLGWFPSVGCQAILARANLEYYVNHGIDAFIEAHGGEHGDPYCHKAQLNSTVNFVFSVMASAFSNTPAYSIITKHMKTYDGWVVWHEFLLRFHDQGVCQSQIQTNMHAIGQLFGQLNDHSSATLYAFVCNYESAMAQLQTLQYEWDDQQKRDHFAMVVMHRSTQWMLNATSTFSYDETIDFFRRESSAALDMDTFRPRRSRANLAQAGGPEASDGYEIIEHSALQSRQNDLSVPRAIWQALSPEIRTEIMRVRQTLQEQGGSPRDSTTSSATVPTSNTTPSQYGGISRSNVATISPSDNVEGGSMPTETDDVDDTADVHTVQALLAQAGFDFTSRACMATARPSMHVAHTEWYNIFNASSTDTGTCISDAGADTNVLGGKIWQVEAYNERRKARVIGYDQKISKGVLPFAHSAVAWLQVTDTDGYLVRLYDSIVNEETELSLIAEYQSRESGAIVDSVSKKHRLSEDMMGTQRYVTPNGELTIPFHLRESLMTFQVQKPTKRQYEEHKNDAIDLNILMDWNPSLHSDELDHVIKAMMLVAEKQVLDDKMGGMVADHDEFKDAEQGEAGLFDPNALYYFDATDNMDTIGVGHACHVTWDYSLATGESGDFLPDMSITTQRFLDQLDTEELVNPTGSFNSIAYAIRTSHDISEQLHRVQAARTIDTNDLEAIQPCLAFAPLETIRKTLEATTQLAITVFRYPLRRHRKSRFAWLSATRLQETVSTDDKKFSSRQYGGEGYAQVFYGTVSRMINVYGMKRKGDFPKVYRDFIREEGIPSVLRRDQAKYEDSEVVRDIQREFMIKDSFSEADNQQQNPVEAGAIKILSQNTKILMDRTGCPEEGALDAMEYLANVHNILANEGIGWMTPRTKRHGETVDISAFLYYRFRQPVYYLDVDQAFPKSQERPGYWINVSNHVGDALTFVIRDAVTNRKIHKSVVRPADDPNMPNHRAVFEDQVAKLSVTQASDDPDDEDYAAPENGENDRIKFSLHPSMPLV